MELLTGDEVYGLLDHVWDMYTAFCSEHEYGSEREYGSVAYLVSQACTAATQTIMPRCAAFADMKEQLEQQKEECRELHEELSDVQSLLAGMRDGAHSLRTQLSAAEAQLQQTLSELMAAKKDKATETQLLDELWQLFKDYTSGIGRSISRYPVTYYAGNTTISAGLKKRLPDLK